MKVTKTRIKKEGVSVPCFKIENGIAAVIISPCYHYIGSDTLYLAEFIDGELNKQEEWKGDFSMLCKNEALILAKEFCAYL